MVTTNSSLTCTGAFALARQTAFGTVTTPPGSGLSFSLPNLNLATWTQVYASTFTVWVSTISSLAAALAAGGTLSSGTPYYYKVTGVGPNGPLSTNTIESGVSNEATATPSGGNLSVTLTWTALQGATSYNIYRGTSSNGENLIVGNTTSTTFTDTGFAGTSQSPPSTPATFIEFDVRSYTSLLGESITATKALGMMLTASGTNAQALLAPGSSNGLVWFFSGTTPGIQLPNGGGSIMVCANAAYTGQVIDSTHKTLRVTNGGSGNLTFSIMILESDQ